MFENMMSHPTTAHNCMTFITLSEFCCCEEIFNFRKKLFLHKANAEKRQNARHANLANCVLIFS
jgi:hypothetical protein